MKFSTPEYEGVWFHFSDRMKLRGEIEAFLRTRFNQPDEMLTVGDRGPYWSKLTGLSYSHTRGWALLCYSETHELGVDVERLDRQWSHPRVEVARRFFHPLECEGLHESEVLDLWVQKEAFAKLTRLGLRQTIGQSLLGQQSMFKKVAKIPTGYEAWIAVKKLTFSP